MPFAFTDWPEQNMPQIFPTDLLPYGCDNSHLPDPAARDYVSRFEVLFPALPRWPQRNPDAWDAHSLCDAHRLMFIGKPFTAQTLSLCLRRCAGRFIAARIEALMSEL